MWPIKNAAGENECHITHICVNGSYGRQHSCPAPKLMFDTCASKDASGKCSGEYFIDRSFLFNLLFRFPECGDSGE